MYEKEEKRRVKRRNEVIQNHKQMALSNVVFTVVILLFIYLIFVSFGIGSIYMAIAESNGFIALILLFSVFALISFASCIIPTVFLSKDLGQNLVILTDRYTLELDRVELLELKTEVEWVPNTLRKGYHREYVTNQYAYFAKHGKYKTKQTLSQGEECYVFVALTKKPQIVAIYQTDEYVISER